MGRGGGGHVTRVLGQTQEAAGVGRRPRVQIIVWRPRGLGTRGVRHVGDEVGQGEAGT